MGGYEDIFRSSTDDPEAFWHGAAVAIDWEVPPSTVLDASRPPFYRWFPDGQLNICYNALDRHVAAGRGDQAALIYDSPVTGTQRTYTYAALRDEVATFAGVLAGLGVEPGDRVVIYLPMVPEAADRDAGLRPDRRGALGGVRRLRAEGAGRPHRRRHARR